MNIRQRMLNAVNDYGLIPLYKLKAISEITECPMNILIRYRRTVCEIAQAEAGTRNRSREIQRLKLKPSATGNYIDPRTGELYKLPDRPEYRSEFRKYDRMRWIKARNTNLKLCVERYEDITINDHTIPKICRGIVSSDTVTQEMEELNNLIKPRVLRCKSLGNGVYDTYLLDKQVVIKRYVYINHNTYAIGKTLKGVARGMDTKVKHQIARRLE
jgi:hypothetical protein